MTVAALFVDPRGPYFSMEGVEPWGEDRDARKYRGPHPVVAHPPCKRWGRYWSGGPSAKERRLKGDDNGCFASALQSVRWFGGVIEHPEASHAWDWFGLERPRLSGGWSNSPDKYGGWTCCVEQGHYGHPARKATWLYFVGDRPRDLIWGPCSGKSRMEPGFHSKEERAKAQEAMRKVKRISAKDRICTPPEFASLLVEMAGGRR